MTSQEATQHDSERAQGVEERSVILPEDLVERILSMVPFPYVFKARALSKSWLDRFAPIASQENEAKMHLAASFRKKVSEHSANWKTLSPIFVLDCQQGFIAYDRTTHTWPRMPSLSFLPYNVLRRSRSKLQIDGSLLLVSDLYYNWETARMHVAGMYVANILTQKWKQLPRPFVAEDESYLFEKLVSPSAETYDVIVFYRGDGNCRAQIYNSKSDVWTSRILPKDVADLSRPTYFKGVLYMVIGQNPKNLLALDVGKGTFKELEMVGDTMGDYDVDLVICNDDLLMTLKWAVFGKTVQVLRVELGLRRLFEMARGPPSALDLGELGTGSVSDKSWTGGRAASDGVCIFFQMWHFHHGMVVYNVCNDEWSHISFPGDRVSAQDSVPRLDVSSFRPNLNPFLAV